MEHPVKTLLEKCGARQEILTDARAVDADLDLVAVHRWHQRGSIPPKYWIAITNGALARGKDVTVEHLARAHAPQVPHDTASADKGLRKYMADNPPKDAAEPPTCAATLTDSDDQRKFSENRSQP